MPMEAKTSQETKGNSRTYLPFEILSQIADYLGLIDLLSFRGTCKDWRAASDSASAQIEAYAFHKPWFLLYEEGNARCILSNKRDEKKYNIHLPELKGATCLASYQGWLLLHQEESVFFFCPFSRAKIELPKFPPSDTSNHVAALSAPPTSKNCIICAINRQSEQKLELNVLKRGDESWTEIKYNTADHTRPVPSLGVVVGATYDDGTFYFLDENPKTAMTYSVKNNKWVNYRILEHTDRSPDVETLPFSYKTRYFRENGMKKFLELEDDVSISTCGTTVAGSKCPSVINNETCGALGESANRRSLKGVWIQPRFHQVHSNQSWSL